MVPTYQPSHPNLAMHAILPQAFRQRSNAPNPLQKQPYPGPQMVPAPRQSITMLGRKQSIVGEHNPATAEYLEEVGAQSPDRYLLIAILSLSNHAKCQIVEVG